MTIHDKNLLYTKKVRDAFKKKKTVKFGTLAQKVGGGIASIPFFFFIYFNWDKYCRREGVKRSLSQNDTTNFCSPYSSFMDFRII